MTYFWNDPKWAENAERSRRRGGEGGSAHGFRGDRHQVLGQITASMDMELKVTEHLN